MISQLAELAVAIVFVVFDVSPAADSIGCEKLPWLVTAVLIVLSLLCV